MFHKKKKTVLTRIYVIYDFSVAFVVSSLKNPQGPQGSSDEEIEETADESAPIGFKGKSEAQQTPSLVQDLDLEELFVSIIVYCTET